MDKVKVIPTAKSPYHKPGVEVEVIQTLADRMIGQGWAVLADGTKQTAPEETTIKNDSKKTTKKK